MKKVITLVGLFCLGVLGMGAVQADESGFQAPTMEVILVDTFAEAQEMKSQFYNCARIAYYGGLYVNADPEGERLLGLSPYEDNPHLYAMFKRLVDEHDYQLEQFEAMSSQCLAKLGIDSDNPIQVAAQ